MPDRLTRADRRRTMQAVKGKGTKIERHLRAMLAGAGLRGWRTNVNDVVGHPDIVFLAEQVAIFVDGCFWHGCPVCNRPLPATNSDYWKAKIARNVTRDRDNTSKLIASGWRVIRIWEHQLRSSVECKALLNLIKSNLKP